MIKMWWMHPETNKWEEVTENKAILLSELKGQFRVIFEVVSKEAGAFCIATHDEDVKKLLAKKNYPVIPASKILKFFLQERDEEDLIKLLPKVAVAIHELGGKVVQ